MGSETTPPAPRTPTDSSMEWPGVGWLRLVPGTTPLPQPTPTGHEVE